MKGICGILIITILGLTYAKDGCFHKGCTYSGESYEESSSLSFSCFKFTCKEQVWHFDGIDIENCDKCQLNDDPHIYSFDSIKDYPEVYHWYGLCNYSLSQEAICVKNSSYNPKSAVYADFVHCNYVASCVDTTTYVINPNTVVTIEHTTLIPNTLDINGNTFSPLPTTPTAVSDCSGNFYPTLVWSDGLCAYVAGTPFSIIACRDVLIIYANKRYMKNLVGLCGFYSGDWSDEYVPRGECFSQAPYHDFAVSWLTKVHKEDCNEEAEIDLNLKATEIENNCNKEEFNGICGELIREGYRSCGDDQQQIKGDIENCVLDCCFNPDECQKWAEIGREMARISCETKLMEQGKVQNRK